MQELTHRLQKIERVQHVRMAGQKSAITTPKCLDQEIEDDEEGPENEK
jgi:hypothetical protein